MIVVTAAGLLLAGLALALRSGLQAKVLSALTPFQLWLPGVSVSASTGASLVFLPSAILRLRRADLGGVMGLIALLCGWNLLFVFLAGGSLDTYRLIQWAGLFATCLVVHQASRGGDGALRACLLLASPGAVAQAVTTIVFRLRPDIESSYLGSALAGFISGPAAREIFTKAGNNVFSDSKAGGFLFNGNSASCVLGLFCCVFAAGAALYRSRWFAVSSLVSLAGAFATGSKTGIGLALIVPIVCLVLFVTLGRGFPLARRLLVLVVGVPLAVIGYAATVARADDYVTESGQSLDLRSRLWELSWAVIARHPFLGSGPHAFLDETTLYGPRYLIPAGLPPHNFLLGAWMSTGIVGAALQAAVMIFLLIQCLITAARNRGSSAFAAAFLFGGALWLLIHGMGDNTTLYGMPMSLGAFAVLTALSRRLARGEQP